MEIEYYDVVVFVDSKFPAGINLFVDLVNDLLDHDIWVTAHRLKMIISTKHCRIWIIPRVGLKEREKRGLMDGLKFDQVFGLSKLERMDFPRFKIPGTPEYKGGTILDYILEIEERKAKDESVQKVSK